MRSTTSTLRLLIAPLAIAATLSFAGCGDGGIDESKLEDVQKQGEQLQKDAADLQAEAQKTADDVKAGKVSAEEAAADLQEKADAVTDKAKAAGADAIEAVEDNKYLSDADKKALEDAKATLETTP